MKEDLIDTFAPPFIRESANRAVTQKKNLVSLKIYY